MADNTTIVDHILKEEGQGRYSVYFKDLTNEDKASIQDWLKDHIEYNDVQKAPALPDNNKAYNTHTENEEVIRDEIKPFNITAFTGDYNDLANAPTIPMVNGTRPTIFNEIAFTGNVNSNNLKVSNVLDFTQYSADLTNTAGLTQLENTENNDKFKNIGGSDAYIKGLNQFVKNTDNFIDILSSYLTTFIEDKKPTFFRSNSGIFFITDVDVTWNGPVISYYQVHLVNIVNSNYALAREISGVTEAEILENIELTAKNVILIFDLDNNLIYCKTQEINNQSEEEVEPYEEIDPIFTASPAANITNENITNWNNKSNFLIFDLISTYQLNFPNGSPSEHPILTNSTLYPDIINAFNSNKIVVLRYNNRFFFPSMLKVNDLNAIMFNSYDVIKMTNELQEEKIVPYFQICTIYYDENNIEYNTKIMFTEFTDLLTYLVNEDQLLSQIDSYIDISYLENYALKSYVDNAIAQLREELQS